MLGAGDQAERYRDLAEECRRLAAIGPSTENRDRYLRLAEHYRTLAKAGAYKRA